MKRYPNSSMDCSSRVLLHSTKHFGEANSFGTILREVRVGDWRKRTPMLRARNSPAGAVSKLQLRTDWDLTPANPGPSDEDPGQSPL